MLAQFFELPDNPLALTLLSLIGILIISLAFAIKNKKIKNFLNAIYILDKDEDPKSFLIWIITIVLIIRTIQVLLVQPFIVDGSSMFPTFQTNNLLIVDKLSYRMNEPVRGDVIVFKFKQEGSNLDGKYFIKRLIALPGDTITIENGITKIVTKSGEELIPNEEFIKQKKLNENLKLTLKDNEYFVMGDNRKGSYDSRSWGPLNKNQIAGRAIVELFPRLDVFPGKISYTEEK